MTERGQSRERRRSRFVEMFHNPITARVILVVAVGLTAAAWYVSREAVRDSAEQRFEFRTQELETAIRERTIVYEQVLWGGVGLFNASDHVSREDWNGYVSTLRLDEHWPGIQGLGYAVPVEPTGLEAHVAGIRAEGFPGYTVRPEEPRDEYSAIIYLEPFDERNQRAFGFDMWSNDIRQAAMTRARDSGQAATSGLITLVQETEDDVQKGFLTYLPVYRDGVEPTLRADREARLEGWVYAAFRMGDLMRGILGSELDDITYEVFDGPVVNEETLLFDSDSAFAGKTPTAGSHFQRTVTLQAQGREWTVIFESVPDFISAGDANQPTFIAIGGLLIDLVLFYVITSLGFLQKRASTMAVHMTAELRETTNDLSERSKELEDHAAQLERSNAELGQFAYVASHDLQEPLRNLGSYSALLAEKYDAQLGEEGSRWLGYITSGSQRMSDLLRELLHYAGVDADIEPFVTVDLDTVIVRALDDLAEAIDVSGVQIDSSALPTVEGDEIQLQRLLQNLLANAIKYRSKTEPPQVTVAAAEVDDEWRISIRDNGIGIKAEYHERIFEIFRRVGSRSEYPGTGIGLAVCRKVVFQHGGTIGVTSAPGEGSEFWFTLPRTSKPSDNDNDNDNDRLLMAEVR